MKRILRSILPAILLSLLAACGATGPGSGGVAPPLLASASPAPTIASATSTATRDPRSYETRAAETRRAESAPTNAPSAAAGASATPSGTKNPFGILISLGSIERANMVLSLGVAYFRPDQAVFVDEWDGNCEQCDLALQIGLKLMLTVRANGGRQGPSSTPKDAAAYEKAVADIFDKYHTDVLVVENEENGTKFYTSTPQEYAVELKAACQVAHSSAIKCANGGMVSNDVALLVWDNYFERGASAPACDFAQRTLDSDLARLVCGI